MFLAGHPNHQLVFMRIWQIDPTYLTSAFRDFYAESPVNITRILDVAQDLKVGSATLLQFLVDMKPESCRSSILSWMFDLLHSL